MKVPDDTHTHIPRMTLSSRGWHTHTHNNWCALDDKILDDKKFSGWQIFLDDKNFLDERYFWMTKFWMLHAVRDTHKISGCYAVRTYVRQKFWMLRGSGWRQKFLDVTPNFDSMKSGCYEPQLFLHVQPCKIFLDVTASVHKIYAVTACKNYSPA